MPIYEKQTYQLTATTGAVQSTDSDFLNGDLVEVHITRPAANPVSSSQAYLFGLGDTDSLLFDKTITVGTTGIFKYKPMFPVHSTSDAGAIGASTDGVNIRRMQPFCNERLAFSVGATSSSGQNLVNITVVLDGHFGHLATT